MMSRERGNFIPAKANFAHTGPYRAAGCGQSGEKFNAGWNKICRSQAIDRILNILLIHLFKFRHLNGNPGACGLAGFVKAVFYLNVDVVSFYLL